MELGQGKRRGAGLRRPSVSHCLPGSLGLKSRLAFVWMLAVGLLVFEKGPLSFTLPLLNLTGQQI